MPVVKLDPNTPLDAPATGGAVEPSNDFTSRYNKNQQWITPGDHNYNTALPQDSENKFRDWVTANKVPFDPNAKTSDYDMRGFWSALEARDPRAVSSVDPNDKRLHYPDYWKTPYHETFSNQSQWATPNAPHWTNDDKLIDQFGNVIFDDRAQNKTPATPTRIVKLPAGTKLDAAPQATPPSGIGSYLRESASALYDPLRQIPGLARDIGQTVASAGETAQRTEEAIGSHQPLQPTTIKPKIGPKDIAEALGNVATFTSGGLLTPLSVGAAGPAAAYGVGRVAAKSGVKDIADAVKRARDPDERAKVAVNTALEKGFKSGAVTPTEIGDQFTAARLAGQPFTLSDITERNLRRLAGSVYRAEGPGATRMAKFYEDRNIGDDLLNTAAGKRLDAEIDKRISPGSMRSTAKELAVARSANGRPLWSKAMASGDVWSPQIQLLLDQPELKEGLREGYNIERRRAAAEGRAIDATEFAITGFEKDGTPIIAKVPNMRLIQMAKQGLDAMLDNPDMRDEFSKRLTKKGQSVNALLHSLLREGDRLNPDWKAAREAWAGDTATMRALDKGHDVFAARKYDPEELAEDWQEMSTSEREFFKVGVGKALRDDVVNTRFAGDESKAIINTPAARQRLRVLFDNDKDFENFVNFVGRERIMHETGGEIMKGSQSAERLGADTIHRGGHALYHLSHGNLLGAAPWLADIARKFGLGRSEETNDAIAKLLTNPNVPLNLSPGQRLLDPVDLRPRGP